MDWMYSAISQTTPLDPTKVCLETASASMDSIESTLSLPLDAFRYLKSSASLPKAGNLDPDIHILSIEAPDTDDPFAEDVIFDELRNDGMFNDSIKEKTDTGWRWKE
ncbi:hypothetical protein DSL72_000968 [Monilinia vaccinii-corymbosi]|uniref:Uncharacterized protein n=1 Tax=Monilinia vaccinii-corymbosi TaxID=61207 RepID=A0A8A3P0S6_9HELO|nr:hypothetical protein DSL72_000968 [Monilinia vaccinii-corymbosi]